MPLARLPFWDTRLLHDFLLTRNAMPFEWSTNDCCTFAADAIKSFTDVDIASDFRGKYSDMVSAFRAIKDVTGGATVADAAAHCAQKYGLKELPSPLLAQRGDLVLVEDSGQLVAGIVHLNGRHVVVVGENGLKRQSIRNVRRAWRV
jgi:hypothetical protein